MKSRPARRPSPPAARNTTAIVRALSLNRSCWHAKERKQPRGRACEHFYNRSHNELDCRSAEAKGACVSAYAPSAYGRDTRLRPYGRTLQLIVPSDTSLGEQNVHGVGAMWANGSVVTNQKPATAQAGQ